MMMPRKSTERRSQKERCYRNIPEHFHEDLFRASTAPGLLQEVIQKAVETDL